MSPHKPLSLSLLVQTAACHSIISTSDLRFAKAPNKPFEYSLVTTPETLAEEDAAILYCTHVRDKAHANAHSMEIAGFIIGPIGFIGAATGTAIATKASSTTNFAIATGTAAASTVLVGVAAYLLTSASTERTGEGLLSAAIIQMTNVDPYFLTTPTAPNIATTVTKSTTDGSKSPDSTTDTTTTTTDPTGKTVERKVVQQTAQSSKPATVTATQEVTQALVVNLPPTKTVGQIRWQTCAKILATWEASKGAADAAMAGVFGSKPGGGGTGGGGNASGDGGSGKKGN